MVATQETLSSLLRTFKQTSGARGSAVVTRDGLPLVSELPAAVNPETFAAMSATMMGAADTAAAQVTDQSAARIEVRYETWTLLAYGAGPDVLLVVLAKRDTDPAQLDEAAEALAAEIRGVF